MTNTHPDLPRIGMRSIAQLRAIRWSDQDTEAAARRIHIALGRRRAIRLGAGAAVTLAAAIVAFAHVTGASPAPDAARHRPGVTQSSVDRSPPARAPRNAAAQPARGNDDAGVAAAVPPAPAPSRPAAPARHLRRSATPDAIEPAQPAPADDATGALATADEARRRGDAAGAAQTLRRALAARPDDSRSAIVAFTLGRVLLEDLDQPGEAATAFARAYRLAGASSLAQDALAREVAALRRAGKRNAARERASLYLEKFPDGYRASSVRRDGGLM